MFCSRMQASAQEEAETEYEKVVEFISSHLSDFKKEYNKENKEEPLQAVRVEKHALVYILDSEEYGVYLDFNDDKGYLVTSLNYDLYEIKTKGDLSYLKDVDFTYYSTFDGFLYHDGSSYQKYIKEGLTRQSEVVYKYNGQSGDGESNIYDINEYVADRYSSNSTLDEKNVDAMNYFQPALMKQTSYYLKYTSSDGGYHYDDFKTENNCALTAAFNVMNSWQKLGLCNNLPAYSDRRNIKELIKQDPDYKYYGVGEETVGHDFYWAVNSDNVLMNMFELYYQARLYAVEREGYEPELGFTSTKTKNTMAYTLNKYGYNMDVKVSTNLSDVISSLASGRAVFMGIANSQSYGAAHAVSLLGYYKYTYKTGVWIFAQTHTAYFFLIHSSQDNNIVYFDPNCNSKAVYEFIYV